MKGQFKTLQRYTMLLTQWKYKIPSSNEPVKLNLDYLYVLLKQFGVHETPLSRVVKNHREIENQQVLLLHKYVSANAAPFEQKTTTEDFTLHSTL